MRKVVACCGCLLFLLGFLLGTAALDTAAAQSSCRGFFSQCSARCANNPKGESKAKCTADHCSPKLSTCRRTGCWTEGAQYGGQTHCKLAK